MGKQENRRVQITKRMLKEAMAELLERQNINTLSITELCEHANVNRSTFYAHYADQYALLQEIERDVLAKIPMVSGDADVEAELEKFLQYIGENKKLFRILFLQDGNFRTVLNEAVVRQYFDKVAASASDTANSMQKEMLLNFVSAGCSYIFEKWANSAYEITPPELAKTICWILSLNILEV